MKKNFINHITIEKIKEKKLKIKKEGFEVIIVGKIKWWKIFPINDRFKVKENCTL